MYEEKEIKYKKRKRNKKNFIKENKLKKEFHHLTIKIDWKSLLIKLCCLFLGMILLIFTISRIKLQYKKKNEVFLANIDIITKTTIEYFKNDLPKEIGNSYSLILEEMKNKKLLSEIKEGDKFCNYLDSYIILTKIMDNEYRLKIYLKCPSKDATIEQTVICNGNDCNIRKK